MAHFAEINLNNNNFLTVSRVVVVDDTSITDEDGNESESVGATLLNSMLGGNWKQTSYNTSGDVHSGAGGIALRKNFAGIGCTYDEVRDAFIAPQPYPSWTLVETTCRWESPVDYPSDGKFYIWNETDGTWDEVARDEEPTP